MLSYELKQTGVAHHRPHQIRNDNYRRHCALRYVDYHPAHRQLKIYRLVRMRHPAESDSEFRHCRQYFFRRGSLINVLRRWKTHKLCGQFHRLPIHSFPHRKGFV